MTRGAYIAARRRVAWTGGFVGVVVVLAFGSYAWAFAFPGSHTGTLRICNLNVSCSVSLASPNHSQSYSAHAWGLTPNVSYDVREIAVDHRPDTDTACDLSGARIGAGFLADVNGVLGLHTVTLTSGTGEQTFCTPPTDLPSGQAVEAANILITVA